ncbi:MAG: chemotaxis protein CheW [Deltaproteobacteria bacterium]|nr:chemotaxis protein CheW [Deltaproteobacteria bacterium]
MADPTTPTRAGFEELYRRLEEAERALARGAQISPEERQKILAERARSLASSREEERVARERLEVVAFRVGGERYAVPIGAVDEILDIKGLCPLLGAPHHVLGALVARSRIVPVLDLRQLLGLEGGGMSDLSKVVAVAEGEELLGLAVEDVEGKLELPRPDGPSSSTGPFLFVTAERLAVLDVARLIEPAPSAAG